MNFIEFNNELINTRHIVRLYLEINVQSKKRDASATTYIKLTDGTSSQTFTLDHNTDTIQQFRRHHIRYYEDSITHREYKVRERECIEAILAQDDLAVAREYKKLWNTLKPEEHAHNHDNV
jgi:hypothetical protein